MHACACLMAKMVSVSMCACVCLLDGKDGGGEPLGRLSPHAVEVEASERAAVVAHNDTVRIQHRYELEDEVVAEDLGVE